MIAPMIDDTSIRELITDLGADYAATRTRARRRLASLGAAAVPELVAALHSGRATVRWEAAKTLIDIESPAAAGPLAECLADDDAGVRWVAAEGLVALRRKGLAVALEALQRKGLSESVQSSAHHVLHEFDRGELEAIARPVIEALESPNAPSSAPLAARRALQRMESGGHAAAGAASGAGAPPT